MQQDVATGNLRNNTKTAAIKVKKSRNLKYKNSDTINYQIIMPSLMSKQTAAS